MALYRDYRPTSFDQVIGQEETVAAAQAGLESGNMGHALLLSGPHGVGKTTLARLIAQCLCCEASPVSSPCGECSSCEAFAAGNHPDILEMDAASNRGVDDARAIRERLAMTPMMGGSTVLIIDEAHMLTREAQNALLKTLEEPPPGAYFMFATTAPDKLLNTIRSRCQQYLLRPPTQEQLKIALAKVADAEGIKYDQSALVAICESAAGSYRDGISLLDQAWTSSPDHLTEDQVRKASGIPGPAAWEEMCLAAAHGQPHQAMQVVENITSQGFDIKSSLGELEGFLRLVLYAQAGGIPKTMQVTPLTLEAAETVAQAAAPGVIWTIVSGIEAAYQTAAFGGSASLALESALAQASSLGQNETGSPTGGAPPKPEPQGQPSSGQRTPTESQADQGISADTGPTKEQPQEQDPGDDIPTTALPAESPVPSDELPGPAVAAAGFPLLKLALRTHNPEAYLELRTAWAVYEDKRLVLQLESQLKKDRLNQVLSTVRRMVNGSVKAVARPKQAPAQKNKNNQKSSQVEPASDRGSLLAGLGFTPLEGERRSEQESVG